MLKPAYKVSHWYPYPTITTGYDAWGNSTEETPVEEYYLNKYEESGEPSSSDFFVQSLCDHKHSTS